MRSSLLLTLVLCSCARAPSVETAAPGEVSEENVERRVQWLNPRFGALTFTWVVDGRREYYGVGG